MASLSPEATERALGFFRSERDRHRRNAVDYLDAVINDARQARANLSDPNREPFVRSTVAGAVLNQQRWQDAERALVSFWNYATVVAELEP